MAKTYTLKTATEMRFNGWIIFDRSGGMRLCRGQPKLKAGEVASAISVTLPRAVFERPALKINVTVPPNARPELINANVRSDLANALKTVQGVHVKIGS